MSESLFEVERILADRFKKKNGRKFREFLVKWKGYADEESTWESSRNLSSALDSLNEYLIAKGEERVNEIGSAKKTPRKREATKTPTPAPEPKVHFTRRSSLGNVSQSKAVLMDLTKESSEKKSKTSDSDLLSTSIVPIGSSSDPQNNKTKAVPINFDDESTMMQEETSIDKVKRELLNQIVSMNVGSDVSISPPAGCEHSLTVKNIKICENATFELTVLENGVERITSLKQAFSVNAYGVVGLLLQEIPIEDRQGDDFAIEEKNAFEPNLHSNALKRKEKLVVEAEEPAAKILKFNPESGEILFCGNDLIGDNENDNIDIFEEEPNKLTDAEDYSGEGKEKGSIDCDNLASGDNNDEGPQIDNEKEETCAGSVVENIVSEVTAFIEDQEKETISASFDGDIGDTIGVNSGFEESDDDVVPFTQISQDGVGSSIKSANDDDEGANSVNSGDTNVADIKSLTNSVDSFDLFMENHHD